MFSTPYERLTTRIKGYLTTIIWRIQHHNCPYEMAETGAPHIIPPREYFEQMRAHLDMGGKVTRRQRESLVAWEMGRTTLAVELSYLPDPEKEASRP